MPNRPPAARNSRAGKDAVAETCFGDGAEAGNRAAARERRDFLLRHVGRVNQAPPLIDGGMFEQPLHRPLSRPGEAIFHLAHLFGGMDVDRVRLGKRNDRFELVGRCCPQAMRSDADVGAR
ncbi:hypothetical protein ACVWYP_004111 [Bradyrhizobium sp. USDA 3262]